MELNPPPGHKAVEHADGIIHGISLADWDSDSGTPLYRCTPVCGAATGVSSDEGGIEAMNRPAITCSACIGILS